MTRRTYHLPPNIDRALAQHAEAQSTTPSAIVRDALAGYLAIEEPTRRISLEIDALRRELHACLTSIKELMARMTPEIGHAGVPRISDRVRARFDQIINKEEQHGNGNR